MRRALQGGLFLIGLAVGFLWIVLLDPVFGWGFRWAVPETLPVAVFLFAMTGYFILEPWLWRIGFSIDEALMEKRFFVHLWPLVLLLVAGPIFRWMPAEVYPLPVILFLFERAHYAMRCRQSELQSDKPERQYPMFSAIGLAVPLVLFFIMPLARLTLPVFLLWSFALYFWADKDRNKIFFIVAVISIPLLFIEILQVKNDAAVLGGIFIFICALFSLTTLSKRRVTHYSLLMWFTLLMACVLSESSLRTTDLGLRFLPREVGRHMQADEKLFFVPKSFFADGKMNFRSGPATLKKSAGTIRIICSGGSSTWGEGVRADESWPSRLEELLRTEGYQAEIVNAGISGFDSFQILNFLREYLLDYRPDIVVLSLGFNDIARGERLADERREWSDLKSEKGGVRHAVAVTNQAFSESRLYGAMRLSLTGLKRIFDPIVLDVTSGRAEFLRNVEEIDNLLKKRGIAFVVVSEPFQKDDEYFRTGLADLAARLGFIYEDVYSEFRSDPEFPEYFLPGDLVHLNPVGNRVMAEKVSETLNRHGVLPK